MPPGQAISIASPALAFSVFGAALASATDIVMNMSGWNRQVRV